MTDDLYSNFAELSAKERAGVDYQVMSQSAASSVTIIAPHGGKIEPGTSDIARALAGDSFNLYLFEGLRNRSRELHITSHHFDEPTCLELISKSDVVIAVHGRTNDKHETKSVWLGGLDKARMNCVASKLRSAGFQSLTEGHRFRGEEPNNICNRGAQGKGIQLELPRNLRDELVFDRARLSLFTEAIRVAV